MSVECIENYADQTLCQALSLIFRERYCLSASRIEAFVRSLQHNIDQEPLIKAIVRREQLHRWPPPYYSQEELGKPSLLWFALLAGYNDSTELLIRSGADVNESCALRVFLLPFHLGEAFDGKNWTVLHVLIRMEPSPENERLIRLVTDHGADLQARDYSGQTVLHCAVLRNRVRITELLLEKGADVNAVDGEGVASLLYAARSKVANELVPLLMKHGADVFAYSKHEGNALHCLTHARGEHVELARVLIEKGVSLNDIKVRILQVLPIHEAVLKGKNELVKLYLDHGADVNVLVKHGDSLLHIAAIFGHSAVMETLLKRGPNCIDQRNINGRSPLHVACRHFQQENVELLVSAGADVLVEDCEGKTPLSLVDPENMENPSIELMIKALALRKACRPSIDELKDEGIIERYPKLWNCYRDCFEEIGRMKVRRFIESCTFFELLAKSQCQIAALMRNSNFETEFKQCDPSGFPIYYDKVLRAFERAQNHYHAMLEQENVINEAVYNTLPDLVVDKVVHYTFNCCSYPSGNDWDSRQNVPKSVKFRKCANCAKSVYNTDDVSKN